MQIPLAIFLVLCAVCATNVEAQQSAAVSSGSASPSSSLPSQELGSDDLLSIQVYNFPEFSRSARVSAEGTIRIPLIPKPLQAAGKLPSEIETDIAEALMAAELVVSPVVTVSVLEYASRPVSVSGAVKTPLIFQVIGRVTLLEAIIRAGGLTPDAGPEILIVRRPKTAAKAAANEDAKPTFTKHINARLLFNEDGSELNVLLTGGEEIRVPPAGKVYVVGDVKAAGAFPVTDNSDTTVLKALSLSGGVGPYYSAEAYIIRRDEVTATKHRIPIQLKAILTQKAPDYPLLADDILFIPDDTKRRQTATVLERLATFGAGIGSSVIIYTTGR